MLGWECFCEPETEGLWLSVHVSDFRLVGRAGRLPDFWAQLRHYLDIEPHTEMNGTVYVVVNQHDAPLDRTMVIANRELYNTVFTQHDEYKHRSAESSASPLRVT